MYNINQDHLELFFGAVRAQDRFNNNLTTCQFKSAFKKILMHAEVRVEGLGNCISLDEIGILNHSSSKRKDPIDVINNTIYNGIIDSETLESEEQVLIE